MIKYNLTYLPQGVREKLVEAQSLREQADQLKEESDDYILASEGSHLLAMTGEGNFWVRADPRSDSPRNPELVDKIIALERKADKLEKKAFSFKSSF